MFSSSSDSERLADKIFYDSPCLLQAPVVPCPSLDLVETRIPYLISSLGPNDIKEHKVEIVADEGDFFVSLPFEGPYSIRDEYTVIHCTALWGLLLLPILHPLFLDIVRLGGAPLAQFVPSSIRMIVAFIATCHLYRVLVSLEFFRCFFVLEVPSAFNSVRGYLRLVERHQLLGCV